MYCYRNLKVLQSMFQIWKCEELYLETVVVFDIFFCSIHGKEMTRFIFNELLTLQCSILVSWKQSHVSLIWISRFRFICIVLTHYLQLQIQMQTADSLWGYCRLSGLTRCSPDTLRMPTILTASGGTGWLMNAGSMNAQGLGGGVS